MNHIKSFKESVINLSRKPFPDRFYFVYDLNKREIGNYLNTWFPRVLNDKTGKMIRDDVG
jgi:hypothetical protein